MITIPTTELIGGLTDVLPTISNPKSELAGVKIAWDGDALHFTVYDVLSGATVQWVPGEGSESESDEDDETADDVNWGGDDAPWATWISLAQAKEILKLFTLPAKLWRFPVTLKCSLSGDRLTVERTDSPKGERLLSLPGYPEMLRKMPDVRGVAGSFSETTPTAYLRFAGPRLAALGAVRYHGAMVLTHGADDDAPVCVTMGSRFVGFIYQTQAKSVRPYSFLRDGSGLHAGPARSDD